MKIGIIDLCKQIEDPRMNRKKVHKMETIIYISIAAVICGAHPGMRLRNLAMRKLLFSRVAYLAWSSSPVMILLTDSSDDKARLF